MLNLSKQQITTTTIQLLLAFVETQQITKIDAVGIYTARDRVMRSYITL